MYKILSLCFFVFYVSGIQAVHINFLPQYHGDKQLVSDALQADFSAPTDPADFLRRLKPTFRSQLKIYKKLGELLAKNPDLYVYSEAVVALGEDGRPTFDYFCPVVREVFQDFNPEAPTFRHARHLAANGAVEVLWCQDRIRNLRPSSTVEVQAIAHKALEKAQDPDTPMAEIPGIFEFAFDLRERLLVGLIERDLEENDVSEIAIVFGAKHNLRQYFGEPHYIFRKPSVGYVAKFDPLIDYTFANVLKYGYAAEVSCEGCPLLESMNRWRLWTQNQCVSVRREAAINAKSMLGDRSAFAAEAKFKYYDEWYRAQKTSEFFTNVRDAYEQWQLHLALDEARVDVAESILDEAVASAGINRSFVARFGMRYFGADFPRLWDRLQERKAETPPVATDEAHS